MDLCAAKVVPEEITPLVPAVVGEKVADDQTCYILETLLKYMVIQVITTLKKDGQVAQVAVQYKPDGLICHSSNCL